jgi:hypothetical protein
VLSVAPDRQTRFPRQNRLARTLAPPNWLKIAIFGKKCGFLGKSGRYFANLPCLFAKQTGLNTIRTGLDVNQNGYFAIRPRVNDNQTRANGIPHRLIGGQPCLIIKLARSFVKLPRAFAKIPWLIGNQTVRFDERLTKIAFPDQLTDFSCSRPCR